MDVRTAIAAHVGPPLARLDPRKRMRPGYLVVGTKRGGSTSLAEWIDEHPNVAPCRNRKGTHYFDTNFRRGPAWYASRFERPDDRYLLTGEASPYYMFHPLCPTRIQAELPDVKLLVVLRDPIDRAWSQYQYEVARGHETESIQSALDLEPARLDGEIEQLLADPGYEGYEYRHHGYLLRGHYADQIRELHRLFPVEHVMVLQSEQMFADPHNVLDRVWDFLELPRTRLDHLTPQNANAAPRKIDDATLARLDSYYRPLNEELYTLPGIDFRWDHA